jgi:hypothetical protein
VTHGGDDISLSGGTTLVTWRWLRWAPEVVWSCELQECRCLRWTPVPSSGGAAHSLPFDVCGFGRSRWPSVAGYDGWWLLSAGGGFVDASWWICSPPPSGACRLVCGLLNTERKLSPTFLPVWTMLTSSGADYLAGGIILVLLSPIWRSVGCQGPRGGAHRLRVGCCSFIFRLCL